MRFVTMSDIRRGNETKHPRRHNAIKMNVDGQPNRRNTETDEVSVIARGRACVRTVQYRHSEVMRSFGRSHIQRCVRAAAAQAMYDPCYYVPRRPPWHPARHTRPASPAPLGWSDAVGAWRTGLMYFAVAAGWTGGTWRPSDVTRDRVHQHRARTNPAGEYARARARTSSRLPRC